MHCSWLLMIMYLKSHFFKKKSKSREFIQLWTIANALFQTIRLVFKSPRSKCLQTNTPTFMSVTILGKNRPQTFLCAFRCPFSKTSQITACFCDSSSCRLLIVKSKKFNPQLIITCSSGITRLSTVERSTLSVSCCELHSRFSASGMRPGWLAWSAPWIKFRLLFIPPLDRYCKSPLLCLCPCSLPSSSAGKSRGL